MRLARFWRGGLAAALAVGVLALGAPLGQAAPGDQAHAGSFCGDAPELPADAPPTAIAATVGVPFSITLDANPTTGYSWELATPLDANVVDLLQHTYQRNGPARPGAGGTAIWTFEPLCTGFTTIVLRYSRPWEPNDPSDRQVAYDIYIH
ncbi:MAG TPA: protease inhibitor I42 family protein [Chloroflexota bacterium]|nr:protease inhibitor I42 family protein [Chloroflexota bacterium]